MSVRDILLLGNPQLYCISEPVKNNEIQYIETVVQDLHDTLMDFRSKYNAGRAIAAPQIGVLKRLIYMNIDRPLVFINPILKCEDEETFDVWDDCMSFPALLVKVKRYKKCSITYRDLSWQENTLLFDETLSELIQHEYDHLDGILAISKAIDKYSFALKSQKKYIK